MIVEANYYLAKLGLNQVFIRVDPLGQLTQIQRRTRKQCLTFFYCKNEILWYTLNKK